MSFPGGSEYPPPPPTACPSDMTQQQRQEVEAILMRFPQLDNRAKTAIRDLSHSNAMKVLVELQEKVDYVRNPSAYVVKTAYAMKDGRYDTFKDTYEPVTRHQLSGQEKAEIDAMIAPYELNEKAKALLHSLSFRQAKRVIYDLEGKGASIRNASAYVITACRTARDRAERRRREREREENGGEAPEAEREEEHVEELVNHYDALDVEPSADETTIKKSYKKLVLRWHPDKHPEDRDEAEERIRQINEAYEVLSNPTKRSAYDQQRRAIEKKRSGTRVISSTQAKMNIPREMMLQPIGYPDKFVRYGQEKRGAGCFVHSRADAKRDGSASSLEDFLPFFKATKFSLWWLPEVNNMVRIRAVEIRTRYTGGEMATAGQAGGLNLAFRIDAGESDRDSAVKLLEAAKGEKKEMVNFLCTPSPYYEGAFRFEAAYREGYFLAYRPPCALRVMKHSEGSSSNCVIDFSLIDFAAMFKFIDVEEVLKPVLAGHTGWVPLSRFKNDPSVHTYFRDIQNTRMWDDEDFEIYFSAHYDSWEYDTETKQVRLRAGEEKVGLDLRSAQTSDEVAKIISAAPVDALTKLPWQYIQHAFAFLAQEGVQDISAVVSRMEAKRKILGLLGGVLMTAQGTNAAPPLEAILGLADKVRHLTGDPGIVKTREEAVDGLGKLAFAQVNAADQGVHPLDLRLEDLPSLLHLPGMSDKSDALVRLCAHKFVEAPTSVLVDCVDAGASAKANSVATVAAAGALARAALAPTSEVCEVVKALCKAGVSLQETAKLLGDRATGLDDGDLSMCLACMADKGVDTPELARAAAILAQRGALTEVSADSLLGLAIGATKTSALSPLLASATMAATATLRVFPAASITRLLLALSKAKGTGVPIEAKHALFAEAGSVLGPQLQELPTTEIIKVALAAGASAPALLQAAAQEGLKRLSDIPPAQLLLLTQALVPLGGQHTVLRHIVGYWAQLFSGDASAVDEVSQRRKEVESAGALNADQMVKLAQILAPVSVSLDSGTLDSYVTASGRQLLRQFASLSSASRDAIEKLLRSGQGLGVWKDKELLLRRCRDKPRQKSSSSSSSRRKKRSRSRGRGRRSPSRNDRRRENHGRDNRDRRR